MYRPNGWPEIVSHLCQRAGDRLLMEDTADALLEALRKEGVRNVKGHHEERCGDDVITWDVEQSGYMVFLPDEKEEI